MSANPHFSGNAPSRMLKPVHTTENAVDDGAKLHASVSASAAAEVADLELEAAVSEAGEHPERAADLAERLGVGCLATSDAAIDNTVLMHAFKYGAGLPPFDAGSDWYPKIPKGSFDAGLARVLAEETAARNGKYLPKLKDEVGRSNLFARMVTVFMQALTADAAAEDRYYIMRDMGAQAFRAGWAMASELWELRELNARAETREPSKKVTDRAKLASDTARLQAAIEHLFHAYGDEESELNALQDDLTAAKSYTNLERCHLRNLTDAGWVRPKPEDDDGTDWYLARFAANMIRIGVIATEAKYAAVAAGGAQC